VICERDNAFIRYIKNILFHLKHRFQVAFLKKEHHYWWRHIAVMLFLPPQTTKYCAHWWCHSQKNLATCYSKQVLVPIYCGKKPNAFNIFFYSFLHFFILFFPFQLLSLSCYSHHKFTNHIRSLSLSSLFAQLRRPKPQAAHLSSLFALIGFFCVCFHVFGGCVGVGVGGGGS